MINTSSHENWQSTRYMTYAISGNRGIDANYEGECYPKLAPKLQFWKVWHDNIGVISEEENNRYYVEQYYRQVLSKLDPREVYNELDNSTLLCYEDNTKFCHRHIVAAWFELLLDVEVPEVKANDYKTQQVDRPAYIKEYLEDAMRKDRNMHGFKSLRALYLFEQSEKLKAKADEIEQETGYCDEELRQVACFYRCDADTVEEKYRAKKLVKAK